MDHKEIYKEAIGTLHDRGRQYGDANELFERACALYNVTVGDNFTPWHAAIFLSCLKMARIKPNPKKLDNYIDNMNYLAFAGEFVGVVHNDGPRNTGASMSIDEIEDGMKEIVAKFAPKQSTST